MNRVRVRLLCAFGRSHEALAGGLDPVFRDGRDLGGGLARRIDHRTDHDIDGPRIFDQTLARPVEAGVVRHGYDRKPAARRQHAAARLIAAALAETHARALREDDDPEAASEPRAAGAQDLAQGRGARLAVDGDGSERREPPTEQGQPQDLALQDPDIGWEHLVERNGLPGRLVLAEDDRRTVGQVLGPRHAETQPAGLLQPPDAEMRPVLDDEAVACAVGQGPDDQSERREYAQRRQDAGVKHEGTQVQ